MPIDKKQQILFKNRLKQFCEQVITQRIASSRAAMDSAQSAANEEEKSSAGDKYETARAMSHLEKDMHAKQLMAHLQELGALRAINTDVIYTTPVAGAFVDCGTISFFIAAGLGKQVIDNITVIFLSVQSPLAQKLAGKQSGDMLAFNGEVTISAIY